jgi:hypothetical protein
MIEYQYSLDTPDPITRLGIQGLYRALKYPRTPLPEGLKFTLTSPGSFTLAGTAEALYQFVSESMIPDDNHLVIPPGYENDPSKLKFAAGAIAHRALVQSFFATKGGKTVKHDNNQSTHPDLKVDQFKTIVWQSSGEQKVNVRCRPVLAGDQAKKFDPANTKPKIQMAGSWHPLFGAWNNRYESLTKSDAFALYFIPWGYLWFRVIPENQENTNVEVAGVGLDLNSFAETDSIHKRARQIGVGYWVTDVYTGIEVGLLTVLANCRLPLDKPYSVIQGKTHRWLNPQGSIDHQIALKLTETLEDGAPNSVQMAQSNKELRVLRSVQTFWRGHQQSLHDLVYRNLTLGAAWYTGLGNLASYGSKSKDMKKNSYWEYEMAKALGTMNTFLSKDDEQLMVRMAAKAKLAIHKDLGTRDYAKSSAVIKNALRGATGRDALMRAWTNVICVDPNHAFVMSEQEVKVFLAFLDSNPQQLRDLLLLGNAMILAKKD